MRVLIVDDEPSIRQIVRMALDDMQVVEAADGASALRLLMRQPVDLMLLDVMMPQMSGFDLLTRIRTDDMLAAVPVVILSARAAEHDHLAAFRSGADGYLTKPFDLDVLRSTVLDVAGRTPEDRVAVRDGEIGRAEFLQQLETRFGA